MSSNQNHHWSYVPDSREWKKKLDGEIVEVSASTKTLSSTSAERAPTDAAGSSPASSARQPHVASSIAPSTASKNTSLPSPRKNQKYVTVSAIEGGFITMTDSLYVSPSKAYDKRTVPSLAFLIEHPGPNIFRTGGSGLGGANILFDLGLRANIEQYLPEQQIILDDHIPYRLGPGVISKLEDAELDAGDIDAVILSHVHYDHHGDAEEFDQSLFILGRGSLGTLSHGASSSNPHNCFDSRVLSKDRVVELPRVGAELEETFLPDKVHSLQWAWEPIGPFRSCLDIFGDESVYIVDAPGHLPGHVNLFCRTGPEKWIYLAGDSCHDVRLLTGEKQIATWEDRYGKQACIHADKRDAEDTLMRIRRLREMSGENGQEVEIILAHDDVWYEKNKHRMFPLKL
jgi:glyoxylase-like metal-dependent hydrolase (beta-lactamase superfamily II)